MSLYNILKLADKFHRTMEYMGDLDEEDLAPEHLEEDHLEDLDEDLEGMGLSEVVIDPGVVVEEHEGVHPVSYMAYSNLKNIVIDATELLSIMNSKDDLPQWADEALAMAKMNVTKILGYVRSEKIKEAAQDRADIVKFAAGKYDHIDFKPSESAANAAARGLELRKKNKGKGGLNVQQAHKAGIGSGVARAVSLKNRQTLSPATVRRMKAFFDRHEKNKGASGGKPLSQDKGYVAWLLWGGDPGRSWAEKVCRQMDAADKKSK